MVARGVPAHQKKARKEGAAVLFEDECIFRQEGTVTRTWAPVGTGAEVRSKPCRRKVHAYGALRIEAREPKFHFRFEKMKFNKETFLDGFVLPMLRYYRARGQKVHLILDNVGYHGAAATYARKHPRELEVHFLPAYSPDLNPTEAIWKKTKQEATHNRYFPALPDLHDAIFRRFNRYQGNPASLRGIVERWL